MTLIRELVRNPGEHSQKLLSQNSTEVFWVDWREEDARIIDYCEDIIKTSQLSSRLDEEKLFVQFGELTNEVPLTFSGADRHVTLLALNQILSPNYEIRMVWASNGSDTLAFAPLACELWRALEEEFGEPRVSQAFLKLSPYPNVFTDPLTPSPAEGKAGRKWWEFWK